MRVIGILASSEKTLIEELWEYLIKTYLTPKYGNYSNINIDSDSAMTPAMIFFGLFFAIMAACAVTIFNRRTLGRPVRLLLKHDAIGRKNAKTFAELGFEKPGLVKYFINRFIIPPSSNSEDGGCVWEVVNIFSILFYLSEIFLPYTISF